MKKIMILISLLFIFFTSFLNVKATDTQAIDTPRIVGKEKTEISYAGVNETAGFNNIVIFIKFADETNYNAPFNLSYYDDLFNDIDGVSLRDYYLEVSYNQLTIDSYLTNDGTNIIYYQDNYDRSHYQLYDDVTNLDGYGAQTGIDQAEREHELLKKAIDYVDDNNLISDTIDLDVNDDGDIDSITFMVSGEVDEWSDLLWPHKWDLYSFDSSNTPTIDGVFANSYSFELLGNSQSSDRQVSVGILAHETFHLLSAPDLYHYYRYDHIEPVGAWGVMESTSSVPSHMLGYMKEKYGLWIDDIDGITESGVYTLEPLADSAENLFKIELGYSNEYLYIEYRLQEGLYESELPNSGLIVYRVDDDYFDMGNVYGYYSEEGNPRDEVFVFRPGINDVNVPIVFSEDGSAFPDEDGEIDQAAISNTNYFKEMGIGTDIVMFYSDGTIMDIKIFNIVEGDGSITFEILIGGITPSIDLNSTYSISSATELYLLDIDGLEYEAEINNVPEGSEIYYTTDGTTPTIDSTLYLGEEFIFNADSNVIKAAIYIDGELIDVITKEFNFVTDISTDHAAYGNNQDITWYIGMPDSSIENRSFTLIFDEFFKLELDYDYLYLTYDSITTEYTGEVYPETMDYVSDVVIRFTSDEWDDEYYGFSIEVEINLDATIELLGDSEVTIELGSGYSDAGSVISGMDAHLFTVETTTDLVIGTVGNYFVTYSLVDGEGEIYQTVTRIVTIVDTTEPELILIGEPEIDVEVFSSYTDQGISYSDNSTSGLTLEVSDDINFELLGEYTVTYKVTDESGNFNTIIRTINIVDTTPPNALLIPSIDTLFIGEEYIESLVSSSDNYSEELEIMVNGSVDTTVVGEYIIEYIIVDENLNETTIYRYVNVIEKPQDINFVLGKTLNTIIVGEEFLPASCSFGGELSDYASSCEVDLTNVNSSVPGTYEVIYYTVINTVRYEKISYVFVLDNDDAIVWYYDKSRRGYL